MKWTYFIQQKLKVALLLCAIMLAIIVSNLILRRSLTNIDHTSDSIYNDRLIPVRDVFYISNHLHTRRLLLEKKLAGHEGSYQHLQKELSAQNSKIDSLIGKIEKTYLVQQELVCLKSLKSNLSKYNTLEASVLVSLKKGSLTEANNIYEKGKDTHERTIKELNALADIQSSVGKDLVKELKSDISNTDSMSTIQILIVILIGILIQILVMSSKMVNTRQEKFNMN